MNPWTGTMKRSTSSVFAIAVIGIFCTISRGAEGQVVYTPTHIVFTNRSYNLDLNNDGITDFVIKATDNPGGCAGPPMPGRNIVGSLRSVLASGSAIEGSVSAAALDAGSLIGPDQKFNSNGAPLIEQVQYGSFELCGSTRCGECILIKSEQGNWLNESGYLGLRFHIAGETHYGWARLRVTFDPNKLAFSAVLTGFAYEATPEMPIKAGQTE